MKQYRCLLITFFFVASCSTSNEPKNGVDNTPIKEQNVTGVVKDTTGAPISGATVTLEEVLIASTQTDSLGRFAFDNVAVGRFPIKASKKGCTTDSQFVVVTAGANSVATLTLTRLFPVSDSGLVCLLDFSGTATDITGNGHTVTSSWCSLTEDRFNKAKSAMQFFGTDGEVTVETIADLNFRDSAALTICVWVKYNQVPAPGMEGWFFNKVASSLQGPGYGMEVSGNYAVGFLNTKTSDASFYLDSLATNTWRFVTIVVDGRTSTLNVWIDGKLRHTDPSVSLAGGTSNNLPLRLGTHFNGSLDDFRIYDRALSGEEISALYHENGWK